MRGVLKAGFDGGVAREEGLEERRRGEVRGVRNGFERGFEGDAKVVLKVISNVLKGSSRCL